MSDLDAFRDTIMRAAEAIAPLMADTPPQHWLVSDAGASFCWTHARQARWEEMDRMGPPPPDCDFWKRSDEEREILDGIDGGSWYSGISDTSQCCNRCGCVLSYCLTEAGVAYEIDAFEASTISTDIFSNPEALYELHELFAQGAELKDPAILSCVAETATALLGHFPADAGEAGGRS